jgi:hypothetical protein
MPTHDKTHATALWDALRHHFTNAADTIRTIIEDRAWEPLGYLSFAEAWGREMRDVVLAHEVRAHVVYQLLEERVPVQDIPDMVGGVGPAIAESLARQRSNGVPADCAVVREHLRRPASQANTLRIKIGATMLYEYKRIARLQGDTVEEIAKEAIAARFAEIVATQGKAKPKGKAS